VKKKKTTGIHFLNARPSGGGRVIRNTEKKKRLFTPQNPGVQKGRGVRERGRMEEKSAKWRGRGKLLGEGGGGGKGGEQPYQKFWVRVGRRWVKKEGVSSGKVRKYNLYDV